jgi:hypothetical protein
MLGTIGGSEPAFLEAQRNLGHAYGAWLIEREGRQP